ncbi:CAP domain-containing protein [Halorussus sp. JP-T4]|nr:CAP domain-containing protein [Halorussus sp. JP-T4]
MVFSQSQTVAGGQPVVTRHSDVSASGLSVRLQEAEAQGPHRVEDVGYLAVEPGSGTLDGRAYEAGTRSGVGDAWTTIEFGDSYADPVLLVDVQTFRGSNTCSVRYRNLTGSSVDVKVQEERSADAETAHLGERVGYLVVEGVAEREGDDGEAVDEETPLSELDRNRVERLVHEYINERRTDHGLGTLDFDTDLREIARYHSRDMAENDYFSHTSPSGESRSDRYETFGYDCRAYITDTRYYTGGENIAYTYYDTDVRTDDGTIHHDNADELAAGIVSQWMNSEGHRENILTAGWNKEGIGLYITSEGKVYATQNFC